MFTLYSFTMKKSIYWYIILWLSLLIVPFTSPLYAQQEEKDEYKAPSNIDDWSFDQSPVDVLETVKRNANRKKSEEVQNTQLDWTTSKWCKDLGLDKRFTITKTLCYIKNNVWVYLQYVVYIWITVATAILIRNGFQLVTSPDREKQIKNFQKSLIYIIIWISFLLGFYYLIDIYVWVINLFS